MSEHGETPIPHPDANESFAPATPDTKNKLFSKVTALVPDHRISGIPKTRSAQYAAEGITYGLTIYPLGQMVDGTLGRISIIADEDTESGLMTVYTIKENPQNSEDNLILEKDLEVVTRHSDHSLEETKERRDEMRDVAEVTERDTIKLIEDLGQLKTRKITPTSKMMRTAQYRLRMAPKKTEE